MHIFFLRKKTEVGKTSNPDYVKFVNKNKVNSKISTVNGNFLFLM